MFSIGTLEQRIVSRCRERATVEAARLMRTIPYVGDLMVWSDKDKQKVKVDSYHLGEAMKTAIGDKLFKEYYDAECQRILNAIDQLQELTAEVESIRRDHS